jgi:hypothetical protein
MAAGGKAADSRGEFFGSAAGIGDAIYNLSAWTAVVSTIKVAAVAITGFDMCIPFGHL